ncbi:hypothetical protein LCGC14_1546910 [marine sediment metagenome]|uniref:Uncharacterized protein n=1 Tax=marine sediment metagenome TaxID=412755 RepID=A0A0F9JCC2_9ZZZZ
MGWFREANNNDINKKVKNILKTHPFTMQILEYYNIPIKDIDNNLTIEIVDLDSKFAEGNGKKIYLDKKLFKDDFFKDNFHFVIHEFFHWIKRRYESRFYFNDSEEVQSFIIAIAWELINGKSEKYIFKTIYPIVKNHFENMNEADRVFTNMYQNALKMQSIYKNRSK